MSRLVEIPGDMGGISLVDPSEVRAIEPINRGTPGSVIHFSGSTLNSGLSVHDVARKLKLEDRPAAPSSEAEKAHELLMKRAEAVLDSWKIGGEKLYEAVMDLDHEVAAQKGSHF